MRCLGCTCSNPCSPRSCAACLGLQTPHIQQSVLTAAQWELHAIRSYRRKGISGSRNNHSRGRSYLLFPLFNGSLSKWQGKKAHLTISNSISRRLQAPNTGGLSAGIKKKKGVFCGRKADRAMKILFRRNKASSAAWHTNIRQF